MTLRTAMILFVLALVCVRAACEYGMMDAHGPDAQMAIWWLSMGAKLTFLLVTGFSCAALLSAARPNQSRFRTALGLLLVWVLATVWSSIRYYDARIALLDASAATTSPERLRELLDYGGINAGCELDNRIALNPNTPVDVLRLLYHRSGTELCLAQNPNTPDEILIELANRDDTLSEHFAEALERNPRYKEVFEPDE